MKLHKSKLIAIIMSIIIFTSIFLIWGNYKFDRKTELNYYPSIEIENKIEEDLISQENNLYLYKWNKSIFIFLNMKFILFYLLNNYDYCKLRQLLMKNILTYYYFSVFIELYINKKDGKKDKRVCSLSLSFN